MLTCALPKSIADAVLTRKFCSHNSDIYVTKT